MNDKHAPGEKNRRRGGKYENSANINAEVVNMDTPRNTYTEVAIVRIMRNIHAEVAHVDTARNIYTEVATMATVGSIHAMVAKINLFAVSMFANTAWIFPTVAIFAPLCICLSLCLCLPLHPKR